MTDKDDYCWVCHLTRARLPCKSCFRNYHLACVKSITKNGRPRIITNKATGHREFADPCPDCLLLDEAAEKWEKGLEFKKIPRTTLNNLLLHILEYLKTDAPKPFLWSANKFTDCPIPMDVNMIEQKATQNLYTSPRQFLADITLINHNCASISRNGSRGNELVKELSHYKNKMIDFRNIAELKIRYLEDCPHCILNFYNNDNWLTMACPWGHPLILVDLEDNRSKLSAPAKLIRFNRSSERVDIILFGKGERERVHERQCWFPSESDLAFRVNSELKTAYQQAKKYASTLKRKFGGKFKLPKEKRRLKNSDKDYICKGSSSSEDVILLTDDEPPTPDDYINKDGAQTEINYNVEDDIRDRNEDNVICDTGYNKKDATDEVAKSENNLTNGEDNAKEYVDEQDGQILDKSCVLNDVHDKLIGDNNKEAIKKGKDTVCENESDHRACEVDNAKECSNKDDGQVIDSHCVEDESLKDQTNLGATLGVEKAIDEIKLNDVLKVDDTLNEKCNAVFTLDDKTSHQNIRDNFKNMDKSEDGAINGNFHVKASSPAGSKTEKRKAEITNEEHEVSAAKLLHDTSEFTQFEITHSMDDEIVHCDKIGMAFCSVEINEAIVTDEKNPECLNEVFTVEEGDENEKLNATFRPFSPFHFMASSDDQSKETLFEASSATSDLSGSYFYQTALDESDHITFGMNSTLRRGNDDDFSGPLHKKIKFDSMISVDFSYDCQRLKERLDRAEKEKVVHLELIEGHLSQLKLLKQIDEENQKSLVSYEEKCSNLQNETEKLRSDLTEAKKDHERLLRSIDELKEQHTSALAKREQELESFMLKKLKDNLESQKSQHNIEMTEKIAEINSSWQIQLDKANHSWASKVKQANDKYHNLRSSIISVVENSTNLDDDPENPVNHEVQENVLKV